MEELRLKYNKNLSDEYRKGVAKEITTLVASYQTQNSSSGLPYDYLSYCMEYITPDIEVDKNKKIAIYCGRGAWFKWDPNSTKSGIGGSEEAVIYASQVLANKGYYVIVYASPPENSLWSLPNSNPRYANACEFDVASGFEILIIWRSQQVPDHFLAKSRYTFFWFHDTGAYMPSFQVNKETSGVFFLSQSHKSTFPQITTKSCIAGNGIITDQFKPDSPDSPGSKPRTRDPYKCIYASNYGRGLSILLYVWPEIKKAVPQATLEVVYGREVYGAVDKDVLKNIIKSLESMKSIGVSERGKVGHQELANIMLGCGVWTYPFNCGTSETFCITAVKAAAAGLISVTTKEGALAETVNPKCALLVEKNISSIEGINEFKEKVIDALLNHEKYEYMRNIAVSYASTKTWDNVVDKWLGLYEEVKKDKQNE